MLRWLTALRLAVAAISLVALQTTGQFHAFGGEAPQLRGVYNALGGTMTPAWVAQDLGLFTKHGLQHSLKSSRSHHRNSGHRRRHRRDWSGRQPGDRCCARRRRYGLHRQHRGAIYFSSLRRSGDQVGG